MEKCHSSQSIDVKTFTTWRGFRACGTCCSHAGKNHERGLFARYAPPGDATIIVLLTLLVLYVRESRESRTSYGAQKSVGGRCEMVKEMREWNEKMKARRREGRLNAKTRADQERYKPVWGL